MNISKSSAITFFSQLVIFALGIITTMILARALGPEGKGIYTLIILIPTLMIKFGTLGIEAANVYFTSNKKYRMEDIVANSLISGISFGVILVLLFWIVSQFGILQNFINSNQINYFYLWIVILAIPISLVLSFLRTILLGKEEIIKFNKLNIFEAALELIIIVIFLLILKKGVFGGIISYIIGIIGTSLLAFFLIKKMSKIRFSLNKSLFKDSIIYGSKAYVANIAQFLNYRLDMFLLAYFLTPTAVGLYSIGVGVAEKLWMLPSAIALMLFPRISSLQSSQRNILTPKVCRHTFFIISILSIILALLSKPLITLLFGVAFLPSITPLLILLPGIIALGGAKTISADLAGRGKPEISAFASLASLTINIPLNLLFIPIWGISGAAFASTIAYCLATTIAIIPFLKISNTTLVDVLFLKPAEFKLYLKVLNLK